MRGMLLTRTFKAHHFRVIVRKQATPSFPQLEGHPKDAYRNLCRSAGSGVVMQPRCRASVPRPFCVLPALLVSILLQFAALHDQCSPRCCSNYKLDIIDRVVGESSCITLWYKIAHLIFCQI